MASQVSSSSRIGTAVIGGATATVVALNAASGNSWLFSRSPNPERLKSGTVSLMSGATSGFVSCVLFQPFDVVKTIQQCKTNTSGQSMYRVAHDVVAKRGMAGLWCGLNPSLCRTVPGVGMYFSMLSVVKSKVTPSGPDGQYSGLQNFACGAGSRVLVGTVMLPVTVVKTRVESGMFSYNGVGSALVSIGRVEGMRGLYSGAFATALRDAPFSGVYLFLYNRSKYAVQDVAAPGFVKHLGCGVVAGSIASLCTQPQDVLKTRMQLHPSRYPTTWSAAVALCKEQGVRGFYSGLAPRIARRTFMTAVSWTIFEEVAPLYKAAIDRAIQGPQ